MQPRAFAFADGGVSARDDLYWLARPSARIPGVPLRSGAATTGPRPGPTPGTIRARPGIPLRNLAFPYDPYVPRPPLGPADRTIQLGEAARRLGITRSTLHGRVSAKDPSIRGVPPQTEHNPANRWLVSLDDVEAELRHKGLLDPAPPAAPEVSLDAMRVEMLQAALSDEKDRRIVQLEAALADRDAEIGRLRAQVAALGTVVQEQLASAGRAVAALAAGTAN